MTKQSSFVLPAALNVIVVSDAFPNIRALKPLLLVGSGVKYQGALVSERKRERAGERESTLEHLQLSCKSHCRALLLRYDFIAAPTGVEIEVITSSLLPEH